MRRQPKIFLNFSRPAAARTPKEAVRGGKPSLGLSP
jgi:hypothetical protein